MNIKKYRHKKVCIVGYRGYIGSTLYNLLRSNYVKVEPIDIDLSSPKEIELAFKGKNFDTIFYLASSDASSIPSNMKEKDIDTIVREKSINCDSILYLHKAIDSTKTKVVFTSSTNVFGDVPNQIVNENVTDNPQTLWQVHKILSESYLNILFPKSISLRIPNIYGMVGELNKDVYLRPIINKVIRLGIENQKLLLYKNKMCFRDYLHIYDLINALLLVGADDYDCNEKYYTLGCDTKSTISDAWNIIAENIGGIPIEYDDKELSEMETRSFTSDYTQFRELTGWKPKYSLRYGISDTVMQIKKVLNDTTFQYK